MKTKPIIASAVLIVILLLATIVFIIARPSPPAITVRHVKSVGSRDVISATFQITNQSDRRYWICPSVVEAHIGSEWRRCFNFNSYFPHPLEPHGSESPTFEMTTLPTGSTLRMTILAGSELHGLEAFLERFKLRVLKGDRRIRLNRAVLIFTDPSPILSDEFVEPQPK